jgi:hypothetical protein
MHPGDLTSLPLGDGHPILYVGRAPWLRLRRAPRGLVTAAPGARQVYDSRARTVSVRVTATGLRPNTRHAAHVHRGSCRVQGPVVDPLPDLVGGPRGSATSRATLRNVPSPPPAQGWYGNVHEGDRNQILGDGEPGVLFQPALGGNAAPKLTPPLSLGGLPTPATNRPR